MKRLSEEKVPVFLRNRPCFSRAHFNNILCIVKNLMEFTKERKKEEGKILLLLLNITRKNKK